MAATTQPVEAQEKAKMSVEERIEQVRKVYKKRQRCSARL
jgi:hypothetical protein